MKNENKTLATCRRHLYFVGILFLAGTWRRRRGMPCSIDKLFIFGFPEKNTDDSIILALNIALCI